MTVLPLILTFLVILLVFSWNRVMITPPCSSAGGVGTVSVGSVVTLLHLPSSTTVPPGIGSHGLPLPGPVPGLHGLTTNRMPLLRLNASIGATMSVPPPSSGWP